MKTERWLQLNFGIIFGAAILFGVLTPYSFYRPRMLSLLIGLCLVFIVQFVYLAWHSKDRIHCKEMFVSILLYGLIGYASLFVIYVPSNEIVCNPKNPTMDHRGNGLSLAWNWEESVRYHWAAVDGSTMSAWVEPDTAQIVELHRVFKNQDAFEVGAKEKFRLLLETPIPPIDTTMSLSCQRCALEPFLEQMQQQADSLIPGAIVSLNIRRDAIRGL